MRGLSLDAECVQEILARVADKRQELVDLTVSLVRAKSLLGGEEPAQAIVEEHLRKAGFAVDRVQPDAEAALADDRAGYPFLPYEGRSSVVGVLPGDGSGPSLHLSGHVDVVPVDEPETWAHDPWAGEIGEGRIWGRGSGDMKGGLAAYLVAAGVVAELCPDRRGELVFSSVIEEECGGNGMWSVLRAGYGGEATLIGEPTALRLCHAGTGVVWAKLTARGVAEHASQAGRSGPFDNLSKAIAALRTLEADMNTPAADPVFAAASDWPHGLTIGRIEGGVWTASAPAAMSARIRLGFGRTTPARQIQEELLRRVERDAPGVEVSFEGFRANAYHHEPVGPLASALGAAHELSLGAPLENTVFTATTDARQVEGPCFCYGPQAAGLHSRDEWVTIDSLEQTAAVIALTAAEWLRGSTRSGG